MAERCWDPVCWGIQEYGWMFAGLARARHVKRSKGAQRSVAAMTSPKPPAPLIPVNPTAALWAVARQGQG